MSQAKFPRLEQVAVRVAGASHEGPRRRHNEDAFAFLEDDRAALGIVAGGMGAVASGRNAADLTVQTCLDIFRGRRMSVLDDLAEVWWVAEHGEGGGVPRPYATLPVADRVELRERVRRLLDERMPESMGDVAVLESELRSLLGLPEHALERANAAIYRRAERGDVGWRGHGASAVAAIVTRREASIAHVGDCRACLVRGETIATLTQEHTLANDYRRARPEMTDEELSTVPGNVLVRALGARDTVDVETTQITPEKGDVIVLASDGLWRAFSPEEILRAVRQKDAGAAAELVERGKQERASHPGDNLTIVLVEILG